MKPTQAPTPTLPAGSGSPLASQQHPSSGREGGCPQKGDPMIDAATLMAACDEVEVANHPTEYKRAAAARARGAQLVQQKLEQFENDATGSLYGAGFLANHLREIAEALRF